MLCDFLSLWKEIRFSMSLNPCYSGICSVSEAFLKGLPYYSGLNPCYSGICSVSPDDPFFSRAIVES